MNKALISSKNMNWCTPQDFFEKLNDEFGFVLDPAATDLFVVGFISQTRTGMSPIQHHSHQC